MDKLLIRFWFEAEKGLGVGVTGYSLDDVVKQIQANPIALHFKPNFKSFVENINIQDLDQNHVIPNMGICTNRGIWFPNVG